MVLMRMGDDDADQIFFAFSMKFEIGHEEINAGHVFVREANAEVDHQPLARVCWSIAVKAAIHADLAQAAKRDEHEFAVAGHLGSGLPTDEKPNKTARRASEASRSVRSAASMVSSPWLERMSRRPPASIPSKTPSRRPALLWIAIRSPRPRAQSSQTARTLSNPCPARQTSSHSSNC